MVVPADRLGKGGQIICGSFRLELKRILKSRRTLILLAIALLLSVAMAYLPISFEGINRPNEDGTVTELDGLAAIKYKQDLYKNIRW